MKKEMDQSVVGLHAHAIKSKWLISNNKLILF